MLHAIVKSVKENNADIGFGFDGDGDRVGVIDNEGNEIFSDKIGLLIARNLSNSHKNSKFIVAVKSTGLYSTDKILNKNQCETLYWKTGHSHIKRKSNTIDSYNFFDFLIIYFYFLVFYSCKFPYHFVNYFVFLLIFTKWRHCW